MAQSTYSPDLRIELIPNGEQSGSWGTTTNINLGTLIEDAISGAVSVTTTDVDQALSVISGAEDQARNAALILNTSAAGTGDYKVYVPPVTKLYVVRNANSTRTCIVYASTTAGNISAAGAGVPIPPSSSALVRCDTTGSPTINIVDQLSSISGALAVKGAVSVGGNLTLTTNGTATLYSTNIESLTVTGAAALGSSQTVTISAANPAVVTGVSPQVGATITFSTTDKLPSPITAGTLYYVLATGRTTTQFQISTTAGGTAVNTLNATQSGTHTLFIVSTVATAPTGANSLQIANTSFVTNAVNAIPPATTYQTLAAVQVATTSSISVFPPTTLLTIDGYTVAAADRVLVKDQGTSNLTITAASATTASIATLTFASQPAAIPAGTIITISGMTPAGYNGTYSVLASPAPTQTTVSYSASSLGVGTAFGTLSCTIGNVNNGVYTVAASGTAWARSTDANTATKLAAAQVPVLKGAVNGGKTFFTNFKSTDTLSTSGTVMVWADNLTNLSPTIISPNISTIRSLTTNQPTMFQDSAGTTVGMLCRAWVNFGYVSSAITVRANFNVASVVRNSTGEYTITFTNPLPDANYSVCFANLGFSAANISITTVIKGVIGTGATNKTASALTIQTGSTTSGVPSDCADISVNIFR